MDAGNKSRLIGALVCFAIFAAVWPIMKWGFEYVHINGVAAGVYEQFKTQMKWLFASLIKFGFTAGLIWGAGYLVLIGYRRLRS